MIIKNQGFTIVSAIFAVVILALIGTYMVSISSTTMTSESLGILGVRTYFAAKSGIEWGIFKVTDGSGPYQCPTSPTVLSLTQGGLVGYSVTVTCSSESFTERGKQYTVFKINSLGEHGSVSSLDYASRKLYAKIIQRDN